MNKHPHKWVPTTAEVKAMQTPTEQLWAKATALRAAINGNASAEQQKLLADMVVSLEAKADEIACRFRALADELCPAEKTS